MRGLAPAGRSSPAAIDLAVLHPSGCLSAVYLHSVGCGDGWQDMESSLCLSGWSRARRVVLVREAPAGAPVEPRGRRRGKERQSHLPGANGAGWEAQAVPWAGKIAVLVSALDAGAWPAQSMPRLYRERADAGNIYHELKNQWGWHGLPADYRDS